MIWRIGTDTAVNIWHKRWLPSPSSYKVQYQVREGCEGWRVSNLIDQSRGVWNISLLRDLFVPEEVDVISRIPLSMSNAPNRLIWRSSKDGKFTVTSAYHLLG